MQVLVRRLCYFVCFSLLLLPLIKQIILCMAIEISITRHEFIKHTAYYLDKVAEGRVVLIDQAPAPTLRLEVKAEACDIEGGSCHAEQYKEEFRSFLASLD